jgi:kinetochore protein NNF1
LKTCNYNNFSGCFPTAARHVPGSLKFLHDQFTEKLGESMRKEFEAILEDRHVVSSLNELDGLIEEAKKRKGKSKEGESAPTP